MKKGDKVRMSKALKDQLKRNGCADHVNEFGSCIGIVQGPVNYGTQVGPDYDVRWQPSNLRYTYRTEDLDIIS